MKNHPQKMIQMPRNVSEGILYANHLTDLTDVQKSWIEVPSLSEKEPKNNDLTQEDSLSELLQKSPLIWDFILNVIAHGRNQKTIRDAGKHHYEVLIPLDYPKIYLNSILEKQQKYDTFKLLEKDLLTPPRILYKAQDKRFEIGQPVVCSLVDESYEETTNFKSAIGIRILLQKGVFSDLILGDWKGSSGYIKIPAEYYPFIHSIPGGEISHKAHYRLQLLAKSRNTINKSQIEIPTEDVKRMVVPEEYKYRKSRTLAYKIKNPLKEDVKDTELFEEMAGKKGYEQHNYFASKLRALHDWEYDWQNKDPILRNIYFEKKVTHLYFTTLKNREYHKPETET